MNVSSISASISVTSADILTQFGTEHKYHTVNTPEWPNSHNLKIQDGGRLNFGKISITPDWIKIYAPYFMWRCITATQRWPRDQKSKPEVKCVDLSDYSRYLNQFWYKAQIPHCQHAGMVKFTQSENTICRLPPSWIFRLCEIKNVSSSGLDKRYLHQILRNNALDIGFIQQLVLPYKPWSRLVQ